MSEWINPFKDLSPAQRKEVKLQRARAYEARSRLKRITEQYLEILQDPRYSDIKDELERSLGEQLAQLMTSARGCGTCSKHAVRVDALSEIVARPLAQVWFENQRARLEETLEIPDVI